MSNATSISAQIRQFITTNFYVAQQTTVQDEDSLLEKGIVDSTGIMEVVGFLESTFGVAVADAELVPENLDSIQRITAFVQRKNADAG